MDFSQLFTLDALLSLLTLSLLEIVLGIDNIIFVAIVTGKLENEKQRRARTLGLLMALLMRVALLFSLAWIIGMAKPVLFLTENAPFISFAVPSVMDYFALSVRDIILLAGGIFLLFNATIEINRKITGLEKHEEQASASGNFRKAIFQIMLIDVVFSFDSILTAIGLSNNLSIMVIAVIISMVVMLLFSGQVSQIISKYPTIKMLALAFLLMIGMVLVADGLHFHVPRGYVYFSVAFSLMVEFLNLRMKSGEEKRKSNK